MTNVQLTIKNPDDKTKSMTSDFLVDSGAGYTVVPARLVQKLSLKPSFYRQFKLANNKKVRRPVGSAIVRYGTEEIATPVVLGKPGDSALLGAITLEAFGLALDPFQRKIYRATMML